MYLGSQMAVVGHTVGPDTIGAISRLELDTAFADTPWRAMIIKDNDGDYGICVAAWKGVTKGVPGTKPTAHRKGVPGIPPNHGHFLMHFLNLRTGQVSKMKLNSSSYRNFVDMDGLQVDWDGGNILVKKGAGDIAQRICLAFITSTLYLLVQPRPEDIEEAEQSWIKYKTFTSKKASYFAFYIILLLSLLLLLLLQHSLSLPTTCKCN